MTQITKTYPIKGMHCASCAVIIEKTLSAHSGVSSVQANYGTEKAKISFDPAKTNVAELSGAIKPLGYSLVETDYSMHAGKTAQEMGMSEEDHAMHMGLGQSKAEKLAEIRAMKQKVLSVMPMAVWSIAMMAWDYLAQADLITEQPSWLMGSVGYISLLFAGYALFYVGQPYVTGFYRFLRYGKANMDSLVGIGTLAAFFYSVAVMAFAQPLSGLLDTSHTYFDVTIVVVAFITLGKYLEASAKVRTGEAIQKLLGLQVKSAMVMRNGREIEVPIQEVRAGDIIVVKPGGKIPVDGVVESGESFVDESMITGEPMAVAKHMGSQVAAGTINTTGSFTFTATKVGADTLLAHIIAMVEEAQGSRAPIQALADRVSAVFVPTVMVIAIVSLIAWIALGIGSLGLARAVSFGLVSFVSVLVIACPCALGLATPTAIIVGVGKGAKSGILVKDAATLERLHRVTTLVVDKTGTLTLGKPQLVSIKNLTSRSDEELVGITAALEAKSEHPIAHAVLTYAEQRGIVPPQVSSFQAIKGKGVTAQIDGIAYVAGNLALMKDERVAIDASGIAAEAKQGRTPVLLASGGVLQGMLFVADPVKPEAAKAIKELSDMGVSTVMLTGDNQDTARAVADQLGIQEVAAEMLPDGKLEKVKQLQQQGKVVAMAGDGINDAPALAQADVGIAMATGTDVAMETAGITLLHGDVSKLVQAIKLSRMTMSGIKQNLFWAFAYNVLGIPLAAGLLYPLFGWLLNPVFAGAAMALSSVSVVANSLRLNLKKL